MSFLDGGYVFDEKMRPLTHESIRKLRMSLNRSQLVTFYHMNDDKLTMCRYTYEPGVRAVKDSRNLTRSEWSEYQDRAITVLFPNLAQRVYRHSVWGEGSLV